MNSSMLYPLFLAVHVDDAIDDGGGDDEEGDADGVGLGTVFDEHSEEDAPVVFMVCFTLLLWLHLLL